MALRAILHPTFPTHPSPRCGFGGALWEPWGGFREALGWLCSPESMPSICLVYGFVVACPLLAPLLTPCLPPVFIAQSPSFSVAARTFTAGCQQRGSPDRS
jgi:hypothetical protein